ncbi:MAG: FprA family A-type flavoprotein, partial [Treponema sp.]|nr:FprA family A-type flavoprotein [Treponema sp.]
MEAKLLGAGIHCLSADDPRGGLFEGIWPIPDGYSVNAYAIRGEKLALIDLFRDQASAPDHFDLGLASIGLKFSDVDYLILNHLEPNHSGWLGEFHALYPAAKIVSTAKGCALINSFYKFNDGLIQVKDGDELDLGAGRTLKFFETPNLHWPETMMTWDQATGTLFSCDAFGSFGALGGRLFDDEFDEDEHAFFEGESLRYFSNIIASYSMFVEKAARRLESLDIKAIAPSHGIVWRRDPRRVIERYARFASYAKGPAEKRVAVIWGSMYGSTEAGVRAVIRGIEDEGVPYSSTRVPD